MEWLRFCVVAIFLLASLGMAVISVAGVFKFKFIFSIKLFNVSFNSIVSITIHALYF